MSDLNSRILEAMQDIGVGAADLRIVIRRVLTVCDRIEARRRANGFVGDAMQRAGAGAAQEIREEIAKALWVEIDE